MNQRNFILQCTNLSKRVPMGDAELTILDQVNLSLTKGEAVAVMGASGSGKSTLLGLLAGLDSASSGSVQFVGQNLEQLDEDQRAALRRRQLGFVFQSFHLLPALNALENVMLALEVAGFDRCRERARDALAAVGLDQRLQHYPGELSGGEQQRVAVARAFCIEPQLLLADEPTGNLDRATGEQVADLLFRLQHEHRITLLMVTHDPNLAARCDRQLALDRGRLVNDSESALNPA
ncbi:MAG: ABC transporter ATP-binding protein [Wenzhouxiangellaceae bacterium]